MYSKGNIKLKTKFYLVGHKNGSQYLYITAKVSVNWDKDVFMFIPVEGEDPKYSLIENIVFFRKEDSNSDHFNITDFVYIQNEPLDTEKIINKFNKVFTNFHIEDIKKK